MFKHSLKILIAALVCLHFQPVAGESGPDNGTDYIKVLFAEAQTELVHLFEPLTELQVRDLEVDKNFQDWLLQPMRQTSGKAHWESLRSYLAEIRLSFQTEPCQDSQGRKASICYFNENPNDPYVVISLSENKHTTSQQAMAMLIHEAGHFVGEKDHLFLDQLGTQLVQALKQPKFISFTLESKETVANVFAAKQDCEKGQSPQAQNLIQESKLKLQEICQSRGRTCDFNQALLVFKGISHFEPGVGFTMEVTCQLKLGYSL